MLSNYLFRYFLNDFEMVQVVPVITGIISVLTFHIRCISIAMSLYFKTFSTALLIIFPSPELAVARRVLSPLSRIIMSGYYQ